MRLQQHEVPLQARPRPRRPGGRAPRAVRRLHPLPVAEGQARRRGRRLEPAGRAAAPASAGEALLQAIFADPRDDAARLIYADWLTDHGTPADHDLADFIRVSTRILHEGPQPDLVAEQGRLWAARKGEWLAAVPESLRPKLNTRGGVFNHATLTWTQLRRYGEEFAGLFPIDSLDVGGKLDLRTAGQVGVLKLWQRVRWLTLRDTPGVPLPALEMVFRSHYLSAVRDLTFLRGNLTAHEGRVLAGCATAARSRR